MKSKKLLKHPLFIIGMGVIAVCLIIIFLNPGKSAQKSNAESKSIVTTEAPQEVRAGLPIRLKIPKIEVDAALERVGLTANGEVGAPKSPADPAWFELSPRPGEKGNAIIDGHFGWKNNIPAVFDNLHKLVKGDKIYVVDERGATISFVVREVRPFGEYEDPSSVFISNDGKSHLNLITCEGVYDKVTKSYSKRLVVFADKEITI